MGVRAHALTAGRRDPVIGFCLPRGGAIELVGNRAGLLKLADDLRVAADSGRRDELIVFAENTVELRIRRTR